MAGSFFVLCILLPVPCKEYDACKKQHKEDYAARRSQNIAHVDCLEQCLSVFAFLIEEVANQTADEDRNGNVKMAPPAMDSPAEPMV